MSFNTSNTELPCQSCQTCQVATRRWQICELSKRVTKSGLSWCDGCIPDAGASVAPAEACETSCHANAHYQSLFATGQMTRWQLRGHHYRTPRTKRCRWCWCASIVTSFRSSGLTKPSDYPSRSRLIRTCFEANSLESNSFYCRDHIQMIPKPKI